MSIRIHMKLNQHCKYSLILILFIFLGHLDATVYIPDDIEENIKLTIHEKERVYYELDDDGLIYNNIGKEYKIGDSIQVVIHSRTIKAKMGNGKKNYGFSIQINDNEPIQLEYKKEGSNVISSDRPGWNYTQSGTWTIYLPIQENEYKITILPFKKKPVIYLRLTGKLIKKKGRFTNIIKTVNHQTRTKIETKKRGDQNKGTVFTLWYLLNESNQHQFEIKGPSTVRIFSRILFDSGKQTDDYYLLIREDGIDLGTYYFITEISDKSSVFDSQDSVSKWRSIWLTIPKGKHNYTLSLPGIEDNDKHKIFIRLKEWANE